LEKVHVPREQYKEVKGKQIGGKQGEGGGRLVKGEVTEEVYQIHGEHNKSQ